MDFEARGDDDSSRADRDGDESRIGEGVDERDVEGMRVDKDFLVARWPPTV